MWLCGGLASLGGRSLGWRARGTWLAVIVGVASDGEKGWWEVLVGVSGEVKARQRLGWMFNVAPRWRWKSTNGREWWSEV
jgi:hypothetical protein